MGECTMCGAVPVGMIPRMNQLALRALRAITITFILALSLSGVAQAAQPQLYWTNNAQGSTIGSANLDGTGATQTFITGASAPVAVAADGQHVYWSDGNSNTIAEAQLDGTGINQNFITGTISPGGVAVDGQHIYWTDETQGTIGRANLDGTGVTLNFISGAFNPAGLAVDGRHIYWANPGNGTIGRANLDGTAVNESLITGASGPLGVAVDAQHVYWSNSLTNTIGRANLDGTAPIQSFITDNATTEGIATDGQHVFWGNIAGRIGEADLNGNVINASLVTGASGPFGLAVPAIAAARAASSTLTFGAQPRSTLSAPQTVTLTDAGTAPLTLSGLAFTGADPGDFIVSSDTCLGAVAPLQSCRLTVAFAPQGLGTRTATLQVSSNDPSTPAAITLSGTGGALPTGAAGPQGPTGPQGPAGPHGKQGAAGQIELVVCKRVHHRHVCTGRLVSGPVKFTTAAASTHATLTRGHIVFATGTGTQTARGRHQLILRPLRRITPGSYTLTLVERHGSVTRTQITIR